MDRNTRRAIEQIAVSYDPDEPKETFLAMMKLRSCFPNMKTFLLVLEDSHESYPWSGDRQPIDFIDVPLITRCERKVCSQTFAELYQNADQGRLEIIKGSHGRLKFLDLDRVASVEIVPAQKEDVQESLNEHVAEEDSFEEFDFDEGELDVWIPETYKVRFVLKFCFRTNRKQENRCYVCKCKRDIEEFFLLVRNQFHVTHLPANNEE